MARIWTLCGRCTHKRTSNGIGPLLARRVPAIENLTIRSRHELPSVRLLGQLQSKHPVASGNPDGAGRLRIMEPVVTGPTRSHDELGQSFRVRLGLAIHGRESFVVVVVAAEHQVGIAIGKDPPQWIEVEVVTVIPRTEAGPVPVGKHALSWMRAQVLPKPCGLRIRIAAPPNVVAL